MKKSRLQKISIGIGIFSLLLTIIGATYAYFAANLGGGTNANINASTGTTDSLSFSVGDDIVLNATIENFKKGGNNLVGTTSATATLKANNATNEASSKYNVFFIIEENDFEYTTGDGQTELLLKATDPEGNEVTNITGLKKAENGFDITTRIGGYLLASDYEIKTTNTTEQTWNIEISLINLSTDQKVNLGKTFSGKFLITTGNEPTYELVKINSITPTTNHNSITASLEYETGTSEIDKYYYAIEEDASAVALLSLNKVSSIAAKELNYIESEEPTHTFDNLKPNTSYKVYSYVKDIYGINSNVYETSIITAEYILPKVTGITKEVTINSIKITATASKGTNEVSKYYFSKDNGETWTAGQASNEYTFTNLLEATEYKIKVRVSDIEEKYSTEYYEAISTSRTTFAEEIVRAYGTDATLLHHDESLANGANDESYRYTGSNPNNYVCFGSHEKTCPEANLYRIIGVFDNQVKLIKATNATPAEIGSNGHDSNNHFYWSGSSSNTSNMWENSTLNTKNLNDTYLTNLGRDWSSKIVVTSWQIGGMTEEQGMITNAKVAYNYELGVNKINSTYEAKVGLPYVSEYYFAALPEYWMYKGWDNTGNGNDYRKTNECNWMYLKNENYWTITRRSNNANAVFRVYNEGTVGSNLAYNSRGIRPTFLLSSEVINLSGTGTSTDPYRIV